MSTQQDLRLLNQQVSAEDIEFRVQSINDWNQATIIAYKDARYDQRILDEVVGPGFWQKKYEVINNSLYCFIGIYVVEIGQWVWKGDVGEAQPYGISPEKSLASDAQKRAGFSWGIGRILYDFPRISVKLNADEINERPSKGGKTVKYPSFAKDPSRWAWRVAYGDDNTVRVIAIDSHGELRYDSDKGKPLPAKATESKSKQNPDEAIAMKPDLASLLSKCTEAQHFNVIIERLRKEDLTGAEKTAFFQQEIMPFATAAGVKYNKDTKLFEAEV
jgi:hypothetical protein